jgi:superfamily II DNA helicase RecQ
VELSRRRKTDRLIVLPTGSGKSFVFMLPCYVENLSISVVIVPLVALKRDMLARCTRADIDAVLWRDRERVDIRIVIASVEHLEIEEYAKFIRTVYGSGKLGRIVIDEAHLASMWSHFMSKMHFLAACVRPRGVQVPIIMLTATAPPQMVTTITSVCSVDVVNVIRSPSCCPNIRYSCVQMDSSSSAASFQIAVAGTVTAIVNKFRSDLVKSRVIVYMLTRATVEGLASLIGRDPRTCAYSYHAGMDEECRQRSQDGWSSDVENIKKFKVMIATSAFGTGIDHPGIRAVIHVMEARSLLEFYQESGRAGRDGCVAESAVLHLAHRETNGFCFGDEGESVHLQSPTIIPAVVCACIGVYTQIR